MKRVVVTGMGIISPVGNTLDTYWESLINGKCGIGFITRFDVSDFKVKIAAEVKNFDPQNYIEKNEIRRMDLFTQYAMAAASEAVKDSGLSESNIGSDRLGVYIGSGIGGLSTFVTETEKGLTKGYSRISPVFIPMMIGNMASGQVAIKYKAKGVCLPTVSACATSTNDIGEAYRAIKYGYADAIIAGGSEAPIVPIAVSGFTNCMALTLRNNPIDACIPFDKNRDGFVMGEGAGVVILEEYSRAVKRNAKIYAEICGYGNTCDAFHITAPDPEAETPSKAIRDAAKEAGIYGGEKIYINAHGTSTPLNDKTETLAIKKAFGENAYNMYISSTKSVTGHMLGAAGAAEAIAAVMALRTGIIPPTIGYKEKDPECDLNYVPNVCLKADIDRAFSVSLGFGGHNACIAFKKAEE